MAHANLSVQQPLIALWVKLAQHSFDRAVESLGVSQQPFFILRTADHFLFFSFLNRSGRFLIPSRERSIQVFESSRFKP